MRSRTARTKTVAMMGLGLLLVAACERRGTTDDDMALGRQSASTDTGAAGMTSTSGAAPSTAELTDANIVALLDEANKADSAAGAVAAKKATHRDVKAYARMMMGEHHALRQQGEQLAKQLGVTPQAPDDDPVKAAAKAEMDTLEAAPKGAQFDRVYIDQEIAMHRMVLELAQQAHGAADAPELKALIEKARPVIEKHLTRAQEIQRTLANAAS